jgi:hypothetical protein
MRCIGGEGGDSERPTTALYYPDKIHVLPLGLQADEWLHPDSSIVIPAGEP